VGVGVGEGEGEGNRWSGVGAVGEGGRRREMRGSQGEMERWGDERRREVRRGRGGEGRRGEGRLRGEGMLLGGGGFGLGACGEREGKRAGVGGTFCCMVDRGDGCISGWDRVYLSCVYFTSTLRGTDGGWWCPCERRKGGDGGGDWKAVLLIHFR